MINSHSAQRSNAGSWHAIGLVILLMLFVFRVSAQLVQLLWPTPLLPPFQAWHSGTVPYIVLVVGQSIIILVVGLTIVRILQGRFKPRRSVGMALLVVGAVYMLGAAFRLVAGMSFLSQLPFFHATLPALFHIVLAGIVLTLGDFHVRGGVRVG
jgi:hypothetical protein